MSIHATKPRKRAKKWALTVIRSRDLPTRPLPPPAATTGEVDRSWAMIAHEYLVWPVLAAPGDVLCLNQYGIVIQARDGRPSIETRMMLTNEDVDRCRAMSPSLTCKDARHETNMARFQLYLTAKNMGLDPDHSPLWGGSPRAS